MAHKDKISPLSERTQNASFIQSVDGRLDMRPSKFDANGKGRHVENVMSAISMHRAHSYRGCVSLNLFLHFLFFAFWSAKEQVSVLASQEDAHTASIRFHLDQSNQSQPSSIHTIEGGIRKRKLCTGRVRFALKGNNVLPIRLHTLLIGVNVTYAEALFITESRKIIVKQDK